jgi:short-subunit dehydrogenase
VDVGGDTRALITGASKGIGRALALALDARGVRLGLIARGREDLERLAAELRGDAMVIPADVSVRAEIEAAVTSFAAEAGGIDLLIANAGVADYGPFVDAPIEDAERMIAVNVLGTVLTVKAGLEPMIDAGRGHVVVVSSGAAMRAFPSAAVYGGTKAAGAGFAEALRHELSGTGVSVTTLFPGEVESELHDHEADSLPDWLRREDAIAPDRVAAQLIAAIEADEPRVFVPGAVRMIGLNDIAPRLTDRMLRLLRGRSAAPRRD